MVYIKWKDVYTWATSLTPPVARVLGEPYEELPGISDRACRQARERLTVVQACRKSTTWPGWFSRLLRSMRAGYP